MAGAEVVQVVAQAGLDEEAEDHAVVPQAAHAKAMPLQDLEIILEVLAHLLHGGIREEGAKQAEGLQEGNVAWIQKGREFSEEGLGSAPEIQQRSRQSRVFQQARQGPLHIRAGRSEMGQGNVKAFVRFPGEAQTHQMPPGWVQVRGLGIQAEAPGLTAGPYRVFQIPRGGRCAIGAGRGVARGGGGDRELLGESLEAQLLEGLPGPGLFHPRVNQLCEGDRQFQIRHDGHETLHQGQSLQGGFQAIPVGFALEFAAVSQDLVQVAVLFHQVPGPLLADALHALDVVAGIPHEGEHVHHLSGSHAEAFLDPSLIDPDLAIPVVQYLDLPGIIHQLQQVLVRTHDHRGEPCSRCLAGQGAQDVIGLEARQLHDGNVQGQDQLPDQGDLRPEVLGHLGTVGLVFRVDDVAEGGLGAVEDAGQVGRLVLVHQGQEHPGHGVGRTILDAHVGVIGPKNQGEGIDQVEAVF